MSSHHLVFGKINDFLTGEEIEDTHDERFRQKIAEILVKEKNIKKSNIRKNIKIKISLNGAFVEIPIDYTIFKVNQPVMIIRYAPGSLVSRERSGVAMSRLLSENEVPLCVVTNGIDAEIIDVESGSIVKSGGLDIIPDSEQLSQVKIKRKVDKDIKRKAERIVFAFEVNDRCLCDDRICVKKAKSQDG
ncbi:MAG: hypothetical protein CSA18_00280 [Deltaproteobacteria bacterium]|nr:MAG: hypothetical protein CSA18_00280 [Deltaproteobacteria bacterium]